MVCAPNRTALHDRTAGEETSELHIELLDLLRLLSCCCDPLGHGWPRHDAGAVVRAIRVKLHVVGEKARAHRRIHGISGRECAEEIRTSVGRQTIAPDRDHTLDIALRAGPDLE